MFIHVFWQANKLTSLWRQDEIAQNRYLIGKIYITNLNIALREKDDAKRSYLQALKSFWTAYYDLRRLTLYDFANKRLLYVPEE